MHVLWNVFAVIGIAVIAVFVSAGGYLCYVTVRSAVRSARHTAPAPVSANAVLSGLQLTVSTGPLSAHGDDAIRARNQVN